MAMESDQNCTHDPESKVVGKCANCGGPVDNAKGGWLFGEQAFCGRCDILIFLEDEPRRWVMLIAGFLAVPALLGVNILLVCFVFAPRLRAGSVNWGMGLALYVFLTFWLLMELASWLFSRAASLTICQDGLETETLWKHTDHVAFQDVTQVISGPFGCRIGVRRAFPKNCSM